ncbi:MAG: hypothetical protein HQM09_24655, partial [Candidatus Riflebacteria bacterium]|nr:hypothetical protein [Candidatus Riflebacteria bacterium]
SMAAQDDSGALDSLSERKVSSNEESVLRAKGPMGKGGAFTSGSMKPGAPIIAKKESEELRRTSAGRDRGALPVEMQLPKNGISIRVFKNVLTPEEVAQFNGIALWGPLAGLIFPAFAFLGLIVYLIMQFFAMWNFSMLPSLLFVLYSLFLIVLEEWIPQSIEPGFLVILAALFIVLIMRLSRAAGQYSGTSSSGSPDGSPPSGPPSTGRHVTKPSETPKLVSTQAVVKEPLKAEPSSVSSTSSDVAGKTGVSLPGSVNVASLVIVVCLGLTASSAFAENSPNLPNDPRDKQIIDVFIPYSQLGDRLPKDSSLVFLKFEEYRFLHDLGLPEPDPRRLVSPVSFAVQSGLIQGNTVQDRVELSAHFEIQLFGKGFKSIPFPITGLGIRSLTLNGEPVVMAPNQQFDLTQSGNMNQQAVQMQQFQQNEMQSQQAMNINRQVNAPPQFDRDQHSSIWTDREGLVVLDAVLVKDLFSKNEPHAKVEGFQMPIPSFAVMKLDLTVNRPGQRVEVNPSVGLATTETATATRVTASLQPGSVLSVEWRDRVVKSGEDKSEPDAGGAQNVQVSSPAPIQTPAVPRIAKVFLEQELLFSIMEGSIGFSDLVRFQIEGAPVGEFFFRLPAGVEVLEVTGGDIANWNVLNASQGKELWVALNARRMDRIEFRIEMELQTPQINGEFKLEIPRLRRIGQEGTIERQKGWFAIESREGLEVRIDHTDPATRIDPQELPAGMRSQARGFLAHAFKFLEAVSPVVQITKHQEVAVSTVQIDSMTARTLVTREGEVLTRMQLTMRNNNNQFLILGQLPAGMKIATVMVNGEPVKPGLSKAGEIYIPLIRSPRRGKAFEPFGVAIIFEQRQSSLRDSGKIHLILPSLSFDVSVMAWEIDTPDGYFAMKKKGDFSPGMPEDISPMPGRVQAGELSNKMSNISNYVSQVRGREDGSSGGYGGSSAGGAALAGGEGAGLLPVTLEIPSTNHTLVFHRNIMNKQANTELVLIYARESWLRPLFLAFSLLTSLWTAWTIMGFLRRRWIRGIFGAAGLGIFTLVLIIVRGNFSEYLTFLPRVMDSFGSGIQFGFVMLIAWIIMSGINTLSSGKGK